ncbi:GNAT family N-acetyltransferase [Priestia flexa]|uniref:GNAT family N-acetyltransferase n=1 Tax=Priestia flexa TaxID=86664 RepID=UPI001F4CE521|nr:GNAT family N-acetyltransferase [Priestia flexa]
MSSLRFEKILQVTKNHIELLKEADPSEEVISGYIERGTCIAGRADGELVGFVVLLPTRPNTVEIVNIVVKKNMRNQGYGKQLVEEALKLSKHYGYKSVEIATGNSSIEQLALYQKCGFRITGIEIDHFVHNYEEEIYENGIQCRDMIRLRQILS